MSDTLPILTDRWTAALAAHGVRLRRSKVTELMAKLLGHRSSNELVAAAARGDLDPPRALVGPATSPTGADAPDLVTILDPVASSPFAVPRALLEAGDRASGLMWSPWGNLLDVRDAKRFLAGRGAPAAAAAPGTHVPGIHLHALVRQCDTAGAESIDIRSDGRSGQITSTMPDGSVTTHYDGDAMPVVAILHALADRRAPDDEGMQDPLSVDGADLEVDDCEREGLDHVRLHLRAGRRRRTRILLHVPFSDLEWSLVGTASFWSVGDKGDVACGLVKKGIAALGDGRIAVLPDDDGNRSHDILLDPDTDDVVAALSATNGHGVGQVIRALVAMGLPGDKGVATFRAREAAALHRLGESQVSSGTPHGSVVPVTQIPQVARDEPFTRAEWARVDAVSYKRREMVVMPHFEFVGGHAPRA